MRFCSPSSPLCACVTSNSISYLPQKSIWPQHESRARQPLFFPFSELSLESIIHAGHSLAKLNENCSMLHTCQTKLELSLHSIQTPFPFSTGLHEIITKLLKCDSREDLEGTFSFVGSSSALSFDCRSSERYPCLPPLCPPLQCGP